MLGFTAVPTFLDWHLYILGNKALGMQSSFFDFELEMAVLPSLQIWQARPD